MAVHETRQQVIETLNALRKCKMSIINGEAASYTVGSRSVTFLSLKEVNAEIARYEAKLEILDGSATIRGARTVVPLDT